MSKRNIGIGVAILLVIAIVVGVFVFKSKTATEPEPTIDATEGLNIVSGSDFNKTIITDPNELDTGIADSYSGYGEVTIGYGGGG